MKPLRTGDLRNSCKIPVRPFLKPARDVTSEVIIIDDPWNGEQNPMQDMKDLAAHWFNITLAKRLPVTDVQWGPL